VFLNLISNGFMPPPTQEAGTELEPTLAPHKARQPGEIRSAIKYRIPLEVKRKCSIPFFHDQARGRGYRTWLSMSHDIVVKQHGGKIDVDTMPGAFTDSLLRCRGQRWLKHKPEAQIERLHPRRR